MILLHSAAECTSQAHQFAMKPLILSERRAAMHPEPVVQHDQVADWQPWRPDCRRPFERPRQVEQIAGLLESLRMHELVDIGDTDTASVAPKDRSLERSIHVLRCSGPEGETMG